jgi:cytochrome c-type protein NapC
MVEFRRQMRRQVRLPLLRRTISVYMLAVILGIAAIAIAAAVGIQVSNRPIFCTSCHEMKVHYRTWAESSHRGVSCEDCHVMPGMANMLRTKFQSLRQIYLHERGNVKAAAIQAHVPDTNCRKCHAETRDLIVYHNLKITHREHWDRGIACTFCHDRVVHGPKYLLEGGEAEHRTPMARIAYKFTPTMQTCYKCHDGKKAPNTCSTCHIVLGERRATAFNPEWVGAHKEDIAQHGQECVSCHQTDFCNNCHISANPHPANWISVHPQEFHRNPGRCRECHRASGESQAGAEMGFCRACHSLRRQHKGADWRARHPGAFRQDPAACERCHAKAWCDDCHRITRSHPPQWLQSHRGAAKARPESCRTCHEPAFCSACHEKARPPSHDRNWVKLHGARSTASPDSCRACHREQDCQACHGLPMPHPAGWRPGGHTQVAQKSPATCSRCHASDFCGNCHRLPMPHPPDWTAGHGTAAQKQAVACVQCHTASRNQCRTCHAGSPPPSHAVVKWKEQHAAAGKDNLAFCDLCHGTKSCDTCHGLALPHPENWAMEHKSQASFAANSVCRRCHANDFCSQCHPR